MTFPAGGFRGSVRAAVFGRGGRNRGAPKTTSQAEEDENVDEAYDDEDMEDDDTNDAFVHPWEANGAELKQRSRTGASAAAAADDADKDVEDEGYYDQDEEYEDEEVEEEDISVYGSAKSSAPQVSTPPLTPMSRFADVMLNVGIVSTAVMVAFGVKKGVDAFNSIPDLREEVRNCCSTLLGKGRGNRPLVPEWTYTCSVTSH